MIKDFNTFVNESKNEHFKVKYKIDKPLSKADAQDLAKDFFNVVDSSSKIDKLFGDSGVFDNAKTDPESVKSISIRFELGSKKEVKVVDKLAKAYDLKKVK